MITQTPNYQAIAWNHYYEKHWRKQIKKPQYLKKQNNKDDDMF